MLNANEHEAYPAQNATIVCILVFMRSDFFTLSESFKAGNIFILTSLPFMGTM